VLFNTLLDGADGIEEGLVQKESPFAGSRSFGMCYISNRGQLASIGTTLTIQEFVREDDGRMYVIQKVCGEGDSWEPLVHVQLPTK
jgi:ATP-dependent Lon protease